MNKVKGLNTFQLKEALETHPVTKPCFDGIYALDQLKVFDTPPRLIIVNTDPKHKPGKHWLLFHFLDHDTVEMFDSLGKDIESYPKPIANFVGSFAHRIVQMDERIQPLGSALCGHYCLYYAYCSCNGEKMQDIVQHIPSSNWIETCIPILFHIEDINSNCQGCTYL